MTALNKPQARTARENDVLNPPGTSSKLVRRTGAELRRIAVALEAHPVPTLTKKEIALRWSVGPDTVRTVLRKFGLDPGPTKDSGIPLTDLLRCEGLDDPTAAWALGIVDDRLFFEADLKTLAEHRLSQRARTKFAMGTYRRKAREGVLLSIRIGVQHRFRPTLEEARAGRDAHVGTPT